MINTPYGSLPELGDEYWNLNPVLQSMIGDLTGRLSEENLGDIRDVYDAIEGATTPSDALMTSVAADTGSAFYAQQTSRLDEKVTKAAPNTIIGPNTPVAPSGTQNVLIGDTAGEQITAANKTVAIGRHAMGNTLKSLDNIAIGDNALSNVQAITENYDQAQQEGTRNVAIGGQAGYFLNQGVANVFVGRNAGQSVTDARGVVGIGRQALCGNGPVGLSGMIENVAPWGSGNAAVTAVGDSTARWNQTTRTTAFGAGALENNKLSEANTAIGAGAFSQMQAQFGPRGGALTNKNTAGTYSQTGNTLTLNFASHGAVVGNYVYIRLTSGDSQTFQSDVAQAQVLTVIDAGSFTVNHPISRTASGTALLVSVEDMTPGTTAFTGGNNVAVGVDAGRDIQTPSECTIVGGLSLFQSVTSTAVATLGRSALALATTATSSTAVGNRAAQNMTSADRVTALGANALRYTVAGDDLTNGTWSNISGLGYNTRVSGPNQVQIGDSGTTVYTYGAVQNRSDRRDKTEIRETSLGLDFINSIEPVEFKWDLRDDYFDYDEEGNPIPVPKDGSRKGSRFHQGFVAQQIKEVADAAGVDFAGLQHHELAGGEDVYSIGYTEMIAPLVKAVQELSAEVAALKSQLAGE